MQEETESERQTFPKSFSSTIHNSTIEEIACHNSSYNRIIEIAIVQ